ncbi:MAG: hypothetical protein R3C10_04555 [Pirellulales bacterium]
MKDTRTNNVNRPPTETGAVISGTAVVLGLLLLALALATFAWLYARASDRRAQEAWGPERAALMAAAPTAELWELSRHDAGELDTTSADAPLLVDDEPMHIVARYDIAEARGVLHLRRGLIDDTSFDWDAAADCQPRWTHALSFANGERVSLCSCRSTAPACGS